MIAKPPVVLFADRDLSSSREARAQLRRRGAEVRMATSVEEALAQGANGAPDLLILDDDLWGRGGRDLVDLFRNAFPDAEIILLESDSPEIPPGTGQGLFYSGARPISPSMLLELADSALEGRLGGIPENGVSMRRGTVLCVDDDPKYLQSVSRFLSRHGYDVSTFENAEGALKAMPRLRPDLALVDLMMPGMGGLDLAEKIREASQGRTPVVLLTALDSPEAYYESHERGAAFMIGKSEKPQRVLDVVDYFAGDLDEAERELIKSQL